MNDVIKYVIYLDQLRNNGMHSYGMQGDGMMLFLPREAFLMECKRLENYVESNLYNRQEKAVTNLRNPLGLHLSVEKMLDQKSCNPLGLHLSVEKSIRPQILHSARNATNNKYLKTY